MLYLYYIILFFIQLTNNYTDFFLLYLDGCRKSIIHDGDGIYNEIFTGINQNFRINFNIYR